MGVLLQHSDAQHYTTHATVETSTDLHFQCLPHSLELTPSDYHIFDESLSEVMGRKTTFRSEEEV